MANSRQEIKKSYSAILAPLITRKGGAPIFYGSNQSSGPMSAISPLCVIPSFFIHINNTWTKIYTATYWVSESDVSVRCSLRVFRENTIGLLLHQNDNVLPYETRDGYKSSDILLIHLRAMELVIFDIMGATA